MTLAGLVAVALAAVCLILLQVTLLRIPAFVALMVTTLVVAVLAGIPLGEITEVVRNGIGGTLGYIAVVIGLGAMFGALLERSGGALALAEWLLARFGEDRAPWALALSGLIVATPVFFDVALVLLMPIAYATSRSTSKPLLVYAIPLLAGIAVAHAFIPPTPGPIAVAGLLGADLGTVMGLGVVSGLAAVAVGGILWGAWVGPRIRVDLEALPSAQGPSPVNQVSPGLAITLVSIPLLLILAGSVAGATLRDVPGWVSFTAHPFVALTLAVLLAIYFLGVRAGMPASDVRAICTRALEPVGLIILVTGAGGALGKVLVAAGADRIVAEAASGMGLPVLVFAFLTAAAVRVVQGSATVAMITAAGLVSPLLASADSVWLASLATIAIASGATVLSHVNDSGFWLVGRYVGLTERDTFRVWTVGSTLIGVTGFVVVLAMAALFPG